MMPGPLADPPDFKPTVPRMPAVGHAAPTYWLILNGRRIALGPQQDVGRSPDCKIVFDDPLVSRRHAQIRVQRDGVVLEDLRSANGVYVDGTRVRGERMLLGGERIRVGQYEMRLHVGAVSDAPAQHRKTAITRDGGRPLDRNEPDEEDTADEAPESDRDNTTPSQNVFEVIGGVVEKAFAQGDNAEAVRLLEPVLKMIEEEAGLAGMIDPGVEKRATDFTLELARRVRSGRWVDALVRIYAATERPMPVETVDRIYALIQQIDHLDVDQLGAYVENLLALSDRLGPSDRFACRRLEGLLRVARR